MRTFIAIELSPQIKESLARLQEKFKNSQADVKWVTPENIHLTLKFLGELDEKKLPEIESILETAAARQNPFTLTLSSCGAFPSINSPRVIWIGVSQGDAEAQKIAAALEEKLSAIGIPKEKRAFSSHITLGRMRSAKNQSNLVKTLEGLKEVNAEAKVEKITLFKSTLTPKGPIYSVLKEAHLKTS